MSPITTSATGGGKDSGAARMLGSGSAGIMELLIFHPVDTLVPLLSLPLSPSLPSVGIDKGE